MPESNENAAPGDSLERQRGDGLSPYPPQGKEQQISARILLVDDHNMVRDGLRSLLEFVGLRVVGEASDGREALLLAQRLKPDIVLMDISMPEFNGVDATVRLKRDLPVVKVIALSMHSDRRSIVAMFKAGAVGYLTKAAAGEELIEAIKAVANGFTYISPRVGAQLVEGLTESLAAEAISNKELTVREREVLQLLAEGKTSKEIAFKLELAVPTVETHRRQISEKLKLHTVAELTKYAIRVGLTQVE